MQRQKASHRAAKQMISFSLGTRRIRLRRRRVLRGVCGIFTAVLKNPLNRIVSPGRVSECGKIKTDEPRTLDFSGVRGFLVTNVCIVQRSAA